MRAPSGKEWDPTTGLWVPVGTNSVAAGSGSALQPDEAKAAKAPQQGAPMHKRPRGRAPSGKEWDSRSLRPLFRAYQLLLDDASGLSELSLYPRGSRGDTHPHCDVLFRHNAVQEQLGHSITVLQDVLLLSLAPYAVNIGALHSAISEVIHLGISLARSPRTCSNSETLAVCFMIRR